jgi:hypothetical protein
LLTGEPARANTETPPPMGVIADPGMPAATDVHSAPSAASTRAASS